MNTIKVDVENCGLCGFREDWTCGHQICILAWAQYPYDEERDPSIFYLQEEAPEWCPAREGVRVEKA